MKLKIFFLAIFFLPFSIGAMSIEEEAGNILGQSYKSEAAQAFFNRLNLKTDFPERGTFTYNFYEKGLAVKINGGEYIQAIQVYNQTMFFKTFAQKVYGKKLSDVYDLNDIYRVIKMAPIVEDETSGTFVYPNKKPADYLIRVIRKSDNTMRAIAWMMDDLAMEKIIAEATKPTPNNVIDNHDAVWALLGPNPKKELARKPIEGSSFTVFNERIGDPIYDKENGIFIYGDYFKKVWYWKHIEFKRRGQFGTKASFPHALPEGLFWWSSPDDFAKVLSLKASKPEVGAYIFEKRTEVGTMSAVFSMGMLSYVRFNANEAK